MTDPIRQVVARPLLLPDTPAFEAAETSAQARSLAYNLRHGRGTAADIERADRVLANAARLTYDPCLDDVERARLVESLRELRDARDACRASEPPAAPIPTQASSHADGAAALRQRLRLAMGHLPEDHTEARFHLSSALNFERHPLSAAQRMRSSDVLDVARQTGLDRERSQTTLENVKASVARTFHHRVTTRARECIEDAATRIEARGRPAAFEAVWRDLQSPRRAEILTLIENCGAPAEADALRNALERYDTSPDNRVALKEDVRRATGRAFTAAAESLRDLGSRLDRGEFALDRYGTAFRLFPQAVHDVARDLGVGPQQARALADGRGARGSLLEEAVSERMAAGLRDREAMDRWGRATMVVASISAGVLTGGGAAASIFTATRLAGESVTVGAALDAEERTRRAHAAGLTDRAHVEEAARKSKAEVAGFVGNAISGSVVAVGGGTVIERAAEQVLGPGAPSTVASAVAEELFEHGAQATAERAAQ